MRVPCELVEDLLPLYHDKACSEDSRAMVDEHLQGCSACRKTLAEIHEQVEHPREDMEGMREAQKMWMRVRRRNVLQYLIALCFLFLAIAVIAWATNPKGKVVPAENIEVSQVCRLEDGSIVFHMYTNDGKQLRSLTFEKIGGSFYFIPMQARFEADRESEQGIFNVYLSIYAPEEYNEEDSEDRDVKAMLQCSYPLKGIYVGSPGNEVVVWEMGQELPAASPAMERMMENNRSIWAYESKSDWDQYYSYLERTLGDEMFRKEGVE